MKILDWISKTHYGDGQSDNLKQWHPTTGQWFLDSEQYQSWFKTKGKTLYCPGIPGAGKTVMSAVVIQSISHYISNNPNIGLAYVYFTFTQQIEQTMEHVLATLIMQLLRRRTSLPDHVRKLHESHSKNGTRPSHDELFDTLRRVLSDYERAFIVLDALDECGTVGQRRTGVIKDILKLQHETGVNILTTSRPVHEIAFRFPDDGHISILQISAKQSDMRLVLRSRLESQDQELFDSSFAQHVASRVAVVADGMFLLARLRLDALIEMTTPGEIKQALQELTSGLVGLPKQLQHALGVMPNTKTIHKDNMPSLKTLQSVCGGLVEVETASNTVRLIHYTTQEYLQGLRDEWFADAHQHITRTAGCLWGARRDSTATFGNWEGGCQQQKPSVTFNVIGIDVNSKDQAGYTPLATATIMGHRDVVKMLLGVERVDINSKDKTGQTPVSLAIEKHHEVMTGIRHRGELGKPSVEMIKLLLKADGVDINIKDNSGRTVLAKVADRRYPKIVGFPLQSKGVISSVRYRSGRTQSGHQELLELLLKSEGVDVNSPDQTGRTPLALAASGGDLEVV
ncbi:hypothetical protein G7054_g1691 [Neopestalotiopsis clavispora]|nr:hypothetical protein G7054_g1691 [Neopestalotiopsis clavispora]